MIIVKCDKCGRIMHNTDKCLFCDSFGLTTIELAENIHSNVKGEYATLEILVEQSRFSEAISTSDLVLEWMPTCSSVFWLRLLAKNHCANDKQLIKKGIICDDCADYNNAVSYANEYERQAYDGVKTKIAETKDILLKYVTEHEYAEKEATTIIDAQDKFYKEIENCRKKLFQLFEELNQQENQMLTIEKNFLLLSNEHKDALINARKNANELREAVHKRTELSMEELHGYQINFGKLLQQSEEAKSSLAFMQSKHPWIEAYKTAVQKRDEIVARINGEIKFLKQYEKNMSDVMNSFEKTEARHVNVKESIKQCDFLSAHSLLGEALLNSAYKEIGIL